MQYFGIGFLVLIFLEIMSIVWVADWLGGGWTLFVMALSFISGIFMLRHTGISGLLLRRRSRSQRTKHFPLSDAVADSLYCRRGFPAQSWFYFNRRCPALADSI